MKVFRFVKKVFFIGLAILSSFTNAIPLRCISVKNQECKTRLQVINVNSNNPIFYPLSIKTSKYISNCNNINNPYAKICVFDVIKDLNVKVFNLMSRSRNCLGNISKDWSTDNMKKTGFNGYVYDFSVDYDATGVDGIKEIHKYLMKKITG